MKTLILAAVAAASTLAAGAAMAQPYGGYAHSYDRSAYSYGNDRGYAYDRGNAYRYDRYDDRRARWEWERRHRHHDRYDRYDRYDRRW